MPDPIGLFVSFFVSLVGLALFMYGKKQSRVPQMLTGLILMVYPYFIDEPWLVALVAVTILGVLLLALRLGW